MAALKLATAGIADRLRALKSTKSSQRESQDFTKEQRGRVWKADSDIGDDTFQYKHLEQQNSIRLLELYSAWSIDSELCGSLYHYTLEEAPPYEAISYTWDADVFPETLRLPNGHLKITENLASALRAFRPRDGDRLLWVDAICIDLSDNVEKNQQVSLMTDIYRGAKRVLAWLGEGDDESTRTLEFFRDLAKSAPQYGLVPQIDHFVICEDNGVDVTNIIDVADVDSAAVASGSFVCIGLNPPRCIALRSIMRAPKAKLLDLLSRADSAGLDAIFNKPWFHRIWVVQEAICARELVIQCGFARLDWTHFAATGFLLHFAQDLASRRLSCESSFHMAFDIIMARAQRQLFQPKKSAKIVSGPERLGTNEGRRRQHLKLLAESAIDASKQDGPRTQVVFTTSSYERFKDIVASFRRRKCKDDRDRLYGMLGFRPWDVHLPLKIDYSKTVNEVYTDYACTMLQHNNLIILDDAGIWNRFRVPATVKNSQPIREVEFLPSWVPEHRMANLSTADPLPWRASEGNERWYHRMSKSEWPINSKYERRVFIEGVRLGSIACVIRFDEPPESDSTITEWRKKCIHVIEESPKFKMYNKYLTRESAEDAFASALNVFCSARVEDDFASVEDDSDRAAQLLQKYWFFMTTEEHFGFAPNGIAEHDVVVAFCGLPGPYIVRPVPGSLDFFLFSSCYIHGMMNGRFEYNDDYQMIPLV